MTDSYQGSLKLKGETKMVKKRHFGVLMIEDDKIVFMYDNDNVKEIAFENIRQVVYCDQWPKSLKRPEIVLKDGKSFIFCINPGSNLSGAMLSLSGHRTAGLMSQLDQNKRIKQANQLIFKTLNYLLKKYNNN